MPSFATAAFALVSLASFSHAFDSISVARTVTAGSATDVSLNNDLTDKDSFDAQFGGALIMLATTPPGWGTGPMCTLANLTDISKTSVSVTIPADVGPSGSKYYQISTMEYNNDPNSDTGDSGFQYSSYFTLTGASGNWSQWELDGHTLGDDTVPCTSVSCLRKCANDNYKSEADESKMDAIYDCFAKCPGYPQDQDEEADGGEEGGDGSSSTVYNSSSGSATSTASGAAKTTMSTAASATATHSGSAPATSGTASTGSSGSATHSTTSAAVASATANAAVSYGSCLHLVAGVAGLAALAL